MNAARRLGWAHSASHDRHHDLTKEPHEAAPRPRLQERRAPARVRTSSPGRSRRSPPIPRVTDEVVDMVINRVIDNAAVAAASIVAAPVIAARSQAAAHPCLAAAGSTVFGIDRATQPRVGGVGERCRRARARLPRHVPRRGVLAPGRQHPADPRGRAARRAQSGADLVRGIATGYEIQIDLVKAISLHAHKIDHVAHLGPSRRGRHRHAARTADVETIFQAIGQALHTTTATRQSRKGEISTWKAHAPAFAGKMAVEAVDRAMRGQTSPDADLRGRGRRDRVAARRAGCRATRCRCPSAGEAKRAHPRHATRRSTRPSTRRRRGSTSRASCTTSTLTFGTSRTIERDRHPHVSHHTHYVIGSGANDPQKYDPTASRETLDHSIPYIFTVALQDGAWDHDDVLRARARRPARHGRAVAQGRDRRGRRSGPAATTPTTRPRRRSAAASRSRSPTARRSSTRSRLRMRTRSAHGRSRARSTSTSSGRSPTAVLDEAEIERFLDVAQRLPELTAAELGGLNVSSPSPATRSAADGPPKGTVLMLYSTIPPHEKRAAFRGALASRASCCASPARSTRCRAKLIQEKGFEGVYISGAVIAADLGLPDIGLTTLTEVATRGGQIARMTDLPDAHRRRHRLRRADERRAHGADPRGCRRRRPPHRGPGQPEALRPPRRQGRRRLRHRDQAHPGRGGCPPGPEPADHGSHRHPRDRRAAGRDRPREGSSWTPAPTRSSPRRWRTSPSSRRCARRSTCRCSPT